MNIRSRVGNFIPGIAFCLLGFPTSANAETAVGFPQGTATSPQECGGCHEAIYREYAFGFGSDLKYTGMVLLANNQELLTLPAHVSGSATAHSFAGVDPFPIHAREVEEEGRSCDVCHYPEAFEIPDIEQPEIAKPTPRLEDQEAGGLTCASCHLTPDGEIRGPHKVDAPHPTVEEPKMQTSAMCAYCHSMGKQVVGKQTQTFLEWREDFSKSGLGPQQCQNCHMPRTLRKTAELYKVPIRAVARHLWTGGHSAQRLMSALNFEIVQSQKGQSDLEFHIINIGAGHSVPTGSNRRAIYLKADAVSNNGNVTASQEWMFAPWYGNRPDNRAFLEEDKSRPDAAAAIQADAQGPHEATIRAGETRVILWRPKLEPGSYVIKGALIYDLNRYNERSFAEDQTEMYHAEVVVEVKR